jgi:hypothetical protein
MGYMTIYSDTEVEVHVEDIISQLNSFNDNDLKDLQEEINFKLKSFKKDPQVLEASTLDEEYKIGVLKEMFDKFSWAELEDIKKKIM